MRRLGSWSCTLSASVSLHSSACLLFESYSEQKAMYEKESTCSAYRTAVYVLLSSDRTSMDIYMGLALKIVENTPVFEVRLICPGTDNVLSLIHI